MSKTKHNRSFAWLVTLVMLIITGIAMGVGLVGCSSERRAETKVYKAHRIDKPAASKACAELNPLVSNTETIYRQGDTIVLSDTIIDVQFQFINDTAYITKIRDRYILRVDTLTDSVTTYDTRETEHYKGKLHESELTLSKRTSQRNMWRIIALSCMGLIGLWIIKKIWF